MNFVESGRLILTCDAAGQKLTEGGLFASDTVTNTYSNRKRVALALQQPAGLWTNGPGRVYLYDDENRLLEVSQGSPTNGAWRSTFAYDGLGRLRVRAEYQGNGSGWVAQSVTGYPYDGVYNIYAYSCDYYYIQVLAEYFTPTLNTHAVDFIGEGGTLDFDSGLTLCDSPGGWLRHDYYFADGNGNITTLLDSGQAVVASYRYDPFGNLLAQSGALAADNLYRFSSKELHAQSGMYYYGYRFYEPSLQRWLNRDPGGEEESGINLYEFCGNSANNNSDALGLHWTGIPDCGLPHFCPCTVTCTASGTSIGGYGFGNFRIATRTTTYTCTDCRGNSWEETRTSRMLRAGSHRIGSIKSPSQPSTYSYIVPVACP